MTVHDQAVRQAAGETAQRVAALNMQLARERVITDEIAEAAMTLIASFSEADKKAWLASFLEWGESAVRALPDVERAVARRAEGMQARNDLRSALSRLDEALGFIAMGREAFEREPNYNYT